MPRWTVLSLSPTTPSKNPMLMKIENGLGKPIPGTSQGMKPPGAPVLESVLTGKPENIAQPKQERSTSKVCEVCNKVFEGKNRSMLRIQHLAQHFKKELLVDLPNKTPPFKCPMPDCSYETKHKPDWIRHYGSVHKFLFKLLDKFLQDKREREMGEALEAMTAPSPSPEPPKQAANQLAGARRSSVQGAPGSSNQQRTYTEYLPKAELSVILSTAMTQQNNHQMNTGVASENKGENSETGNLNNLDLIDQVINNETDTGLTTGENNLDDFSCFMCDHEPFKSEGELNAHMTKEHDLFGGEGGDDLADLASGDVGVLDLFGDDEAMDEALREAESNQASSAQAGSIPGSSGIIQIKIKKPGAIVEKRGSTGRPCEICGFEPKTKNKSRERQDHLAMKHYRERIQQELTKVVNLKCPICEFIGKDKQTIYRHYIGKHRVVEKYLEEDLVKGNIKPLSQAASGPSTATATPSTSQMMQVDGAFDLPSDFEDEDEENLENLRVPQLDGEAQSDSDHEDVSANEKIVYTCQLCGEDCKTNRNYHLATRHFREKLTKMCPTSKPYICPECSIESKTKNNLWAHVMGVHKYGSLWLEEELVKKGLSNGNGVIKEEEVTPKKTRLPKSMTNGVHSTSKSNGSLAALGDETPEPSSAKKGGLTNQFPLIRGQRMEFWCDLCQKTLSNTPELIHMSQVHFGDKLKTHLSAQGPFMCPVCRHDAKNYQYLCVHYLQRHPNILHKWTREELAKMEEEAMKSMDESIAVTDNGKRKRSGTLEVARLNPVQASLRRGGKHYISSAEENSTVSLIELISIKHI